MALENLFIRSKKFIGGIQLDAVLSEAHESSATVTEAPVEFGADVSDHIILEPKRLTMVVEVSDNPLGIQALAQLVDSVTGLFGSSTSENLTRSQAAYLALVQLQENRVLLDVQTGLRAYSNMGIMDINTIRDKDTSRIVRLTVQLKEVRIRETQVVQLPPEVLEAGKVSSQASSATERGRQAADAPEDSVRTSAIQRIRRWIND